MAATTTLKLPEQLKARIARIARDSNRSAHSVMIDALEREVAREEKMRAFVREARESSEAIRRGEAVYRAEDVHAWFERLKENPGAARPRPWRK